MADGITFQSAVAATPPATTEITTDDCGADGHVQIIKLAISADGSAVLIPGDAANGLDVDVTRLPSITLDAATLAALETIQVGNFPATQPVSAAALPLPSGAATSAKQDAAQTRFDLLATDSKLELVRALLAGTLTAELGATTLAALETITIGTALPAGTNAIGTVDLAATTPVQFLDVDESEDEVKASAGKLHGYFLANLSAGVRYVKFYDGTAAGVTVGSTTPVLTIPLAAAEKANLALPRGLTFASGICVAATTGFAVADTGAPGTNDVIANIFYS